MGRSSGIGAVLYYCGSRMAHYMEHSTRIYNIYLKYIAPEDIHVYSIDEVFIDLTHYLSSSGLNAREFAKRMIQDVLETTGITATAGIGTNMYLAKVAMDIVAKHIPADENCYAKKSNFWGSHQTVDFLLSLVAR